MLTLSKLYAQDNTKQIEFKLENDKFVFQDRYYTNGIFIEYKKRLENDFLLNKTDSNRLQLNVMLGNETYNPRDISSLDASRFDRPFAGWLFGRVEVAQIKERSALFLALESGVTGEESLSEGLQIAFHDVLDIEEPTWAEQIGFKVLFNVKLKYIYNWHLSEAHAFQFTTQPTLGTKDIFLSNNIKYVFGKFNAFNNTSVLGIIDGSLTKEFFGFIGFGHKYVVHNTLLQGGITRDETTFTTSPVRNVFKLQAGSTLKVKRNTYKLTYYFNTKETELSSPHAYASLVFARSF